MSDQVQGNKLAREKRIWITLAICIATILIATFFSSWIQTAGFTYTVEDIRNGTNKGTKTQHQYFQLGNYTSILEPEKSYREYQRRDEIRIVNEIQKNPRRR